MWTFKGNNESNLQEIQSHKRKKTPKPVLTKLFTEELIYHLPQFGDSGIPLLFHCIWEWHRTKPTFPNYFGYIFSHSVYSMYNHPAFSGNPENTMQKYGFNLELGKLIIKKWQNVKNCTKIHWTSDTALATKNPHLYWHEELQCFHHQPPICRSHLEMGLVFCQFHFLKNYLDIQCRIWCAYGMKTCFQGIFTKH